MSAAVIGIIAENTVILAAIVTGGHLLRQGGGLQLKTPPVPKAPPLPKRESAAAEETKTGPVSLEEVA